VLYKKLPQELISNDPSVCGLGMGLTTSEHNKVECSEKLEGLRLAKSLWKITGLRGSK